MLRALFAGAVLLNVGAFAYTQGWLDGLTGVAARGDAQPERLQHQLRPEQLTIMAPQAVQSLQSKSCLEYGPFKGEEQLRTLAQQLDRMGVSTSSWEDQRSEIRGEWAVATIRFPNKDFQQRKEETYKRMRINYEYISGPPEEMPTMLLSRHPSQAAAENAMEALEQRALKGLRVLQTQLPQTSHQLRFAQADGALQARLAQIKELGAARSCKDVPTAASGPADRPASAASAGGAAAKLDKRAVPPA